MPERMIDKKKDFKRISQLFHYINLIKINHEEIIRKIPVKKYHIRYYWFLSDTIFQIYYSISISFFHRLIRSIKFLDSIYQQSHNPPSFSKKSPHVFPFLYHPKEINFDLQTFQKKKKRTRIYSSLIPLRKKILSKLSFRGWLKSDSGPTFVPEKHNKARVTQRVTPL